VFTKGNKDSITSSNKTTKEKNEVKVSEEEIERLKEVLSRGYINDYGIIKKQANLNFGHRVIRRLVLNDPELLKLKNSTYSKFITTKIQKLSKEDFQFLVKDLKILNYDQVVKKWNIGLKSLTVLVKHFYGKKERTFKYSEEERAFKKKYRKDRELLKDFRKIHGSKNETWIEKIVRSILLSNNIDFYCQTHILLNTFKCDFLIKDTKKIIEVNGDYWHGYQKNFEDLDEKVKKSVSSYDKKVEYYKNNGYELLEVWEHEINNNLNEVVKKIINYGKI
jgi:very-short-patch-repair endonuclease